MKTTELPSSGLYTDRRGWTWVLIDHSTWMLTGHAKRPRVLTDAQMSLLIERDRHRDVCEGLFKCDNHPVPTVICFMGEFDVFRGNNLVYKAFYATLPEAMDDARALALTGES